MGVLNDRLRKRINSLEVEIKKLEGYEPSSLQEHLTIQAEIYVIRKEIEVLNKELLNLLGGEYGKV